MPDAAPVEGWVMLVLGFGSALTGGAVLRATGRIFLGLGPDAGGEGDAPTGDEKEKGGRPFPLMLIPAAILALMALCPGRLVHGYIESAVPAFVHPDPAAFLAGRPDAASSVSLPMAAEQSWLPWAMLVASLLFAGYGLFRERLPQAFHNATHGLFKPLFAGLERLHGGIINDYVSWIAIGLAAIAAALAL